MSTRYQKLTSTEQDNHHYEASSTTSQQQNDLQDSFGESFDEDEHPTATDRLLQYHTNEQDESDDDDNITLATISNFSQPQLQPQTQQPLQIQRNTPAVLPVSTDGVFANMSAKPETESSKLDETPPTYEEAAADATPPYWQTTIIAPAGMGDIVLVEGMPVGSIFAFFWNLLISASFQFVGFMLTYLLHTSHASKQGSRAGLGISLVQTGFYIRSRGTLEDDDYYYGDQQGSSSTKSDSSSKEDSTDADIIAYFLMMVGWFIIIRSMADYFRAKQMEKIICSEPTTGDTIV
ncbi:hypothetical protein INT46_002439 [Mucor plumbeus]|uniref:Metal homeostatis protein bsd2 n=1 Tax=Mucor plumbeus TaxID=97098 RepID=A0A8H7V174_9FUNG|nr:hypothetical protein INT46_002439 [Mucor plumbeus]